MELDDTTLVSLVQKGNHHAFSQIYNKYWERLFSYVYNILKNKAAAEEVLHDVFTKIWINREETAIENLKAYLYNAVRNTALLKLRKTTFAPLDEHVIGNLNHAPEIDLKNDLNDLMHSIDNATKTLPQRCREIFYMSKIEHYSSTEIAHFFNISPRTVENQISLALKHLRKTLTLPLLLFLLLP